MLTHAPHSCQEHPLSRFPADRLDRACYPPGVDLTIMYNDLDTNHHLNNVAVGRFFEHSRVLTLFTPELTAAMSPAHFLAVRVTIDYLDEGRFGTPLHVATRISGAGRTSVAVEQAAWQDDRVIALADVTVVHVQDKRPTPISDETRELLLQTRGS